MPIIRKLTKVVNRCQRCGEEFYDGPVVFIPPCPACGGRVMLGLAQPEKNPTQPKGGETDADKNR